MLEFAKVAGMKAAMILAGFILVCSMWNVLTRPLVVQDAPTPDEITQFHAHEGSL